ncbi:hypothetical protein [Sulfurimonas sp.]|uniref:hypothetical protein n=1 Tax=Sulfurimonas sp. TaxID=2022749 RepID=UPI0035634B2D
MDITKLSDSDIIELYSQSIKELKRREIIRTKNITGELGEYIAVQYYKNNPTLPNLQFAPPSTENIDAISAKGERYSIKTITNTGSTGVFYGMPAQGSSEIPIQKFEYAVIVKLTDNFELEQILELSWDEFLENKKWHSRMQAWNLSYSNKLIKCVKNIY